MAVLNNLGRYMSEGARKLAHVDFGRASRGIGDRKFDDRYWKVKGKWKRKVNGEWKTYTAEVLTPKPPTTPAEAVSKIFDHVDRWRFDCSEFAQVVNYYAWLKLLGPAEFNRRQAQSGKAIEIRPFQGSAYTARKHYYWRETRKDWMKLYPNGFGPGQNTCLTVREIVDSAPSGSRILFRSDKGSGAFRNENTIKTGPNRFIAHGYGTKKVYTEDEVILHLYRIVPGKSTATIDEARRHVWIKEVAYFVNVPEPTACLT